MTANQISTHAIVDPETGEVIVHAGEIITDEIAQRIGAIMISVDARALIASLRQIYQVIDHAETYHIWSNLSQARRLLVNLMGQAESVAHPHAAIVAPERMYAEIA